MKKICFQNKCRKNVVFSSQIDVYYTIVKGLRGIIMSTENVTQFVELLRAIEDNKILLPDFQRKFVWTDVDSQKAIVASVLAKLPIGSILLLEANAQDYAAKIIGTKLSVDKSKVADKVDFLLDGQQRITTLANVFSNVVQDNAGEVSNLINQQALKRRFFLKVPR